VSDLHYESQYEPYYPAAPPNPGYPEKYRRELVQTCRQFDALETEFKDRQAGGFDFETTSLSYLHGEVVGYSFAFEPDRGFYIPLRHKGGQNAPFKRAVQFIGFLLGENYSRKQIHYNSKFELRWLRGLGFDDARINYLDFMAVVWNMDTNIKLPRLKEMVMERLLGWRGVPNYEQTLRGNPDFSYLEPEEGLDYAAFDSIALIEGFQKAWGFYTNHKFICDLDSALVREIIKVEDSPHPIDIELLDQFCVEMEKELFQLQQEIYQAVGYSFSLTSRVQVGQALAHLGLHTGRVTKTTRQMKVDEDSLKGIEDRHPVISLILRFNKVDTLLGKYARKLASVYDAFLGGVRCNYHTYNVPTGRLSSGEDKDGRNPFYVKYNIQATVKGGPLNYKAEETSWDDPEGICGYRFIPDPDGDFEGQDPHYNIRRAFLPFEDCYLVSIDFKSQEIAIAANKSGDPTMIKKLQSGGDYHKATAIEILDGDESQYNKSIRKLAKSANFLVFYGGGADTMSQNTGAELSVCEGILAKWWLNHPVFKYWTNYLKKQGKETGTVSTHFGRPRRVKHYMGHPKKTVRAFGERTAVNTVIQGTAGDIMRIALIRVGGFMQTVEDPRFRILSSLHDEINFSIPRDSICKILPKILHCMQVTPPDWPIEMTVDLSIGLNWGFHFSFEYEGDRLVPIP